jgi:hypothetical protein
LVVIPAGLLRRVAAAQALDFLSPLKSSQPLQKAQRYRVFAEDFAKLAELIRAGSILE